MTTRDIRFPTGIRYGAIGGPGFSTRIGRVRSGRTQRNAMWDFPIHRFEVERILTTEAKKKALLNLFMVVSGNLYPFRVRNPADYTVAAGEGVVYALGNSRFQLAKRYSLTSDLLSSPTPTYTKDVYITLPVVGTVVISGMTEGVHYTIDYLTGIVTTIGSPTPSFSSWTGQFDLRCRFEQDELMLEAVDQGDGVIVFQTQRLTMIEERL
jgi:uncharacterized protein (TIGR02217 family)